MKEIHNGTINAEAHHLKGKDIQLEFPSVGATENIMLASVLAEGVTCIRNAAREPEIMNLQSFLNAAGFKVFGAGTNTITIVGVKHFEKGRNIEVYQSIIPDRIVAGTYLYAAAITGGDMTVGGFIPEHIMPMMSILNECGCQLDLHNDMVRIIAPKQLEVPRTVRTLPYPGFPTDMQAQTVALLSVASGTGVVVENLFESRFKYVDELQKMGAEIMVENKVAIIRGTKSLNGARVAARDLRGGAALVLAGLAAKGETEVCDIEYIERGYEKLDVRLSDLGANIHKSNLTEDEGFDKQTEKKK